MKKILIPILAVYFLLCLLGTATATTITVENASFESPDIGSLSSTDGSNLYGRWISSTDEWDLTGGGAAGNWEPDVSTAYNSIPDGDQVGFTWGPTISQTLTTDLAANTLYTLSGFVGWRNHFASAPDFLIELLAGGAVLDSVNTATLSQGGWTEVTLNYMSSNVASGQNLGIRLSGATGAPVDFDMISLNAEPVPEPATMLLFGLGLLGLAGVNRKKTA